MRDNGFGCHTINNSGIYIRSIECLQRGQIGNGQCVARCVDGSLFGLFGGEDDRLLTQRRILYIDRHGQIETGFAHGFLFRDFGSGNREITAFGHLYGDIAFQVLAFNIYHLLCFATLQKVTEVDIGRSCHNAGRISGGLHFKKSGPSIGDAERTDLSLDSGESAGSRMTNFQCLNTGKSITTRQFLNTSSTGTYSNLGCRRGRFGLVIDRIDEE